MSHILDRPAWSALTTRQAAFGEGGPLALRFDPSIVPFAAARNDSAEAQAALAALPRPGMALVERHAIVPTPGLTAIGTARVVQMILAISPDDGPVRADARIVPLGEADAADMLALAALTKPGPFTLRAQALGSFVGVRENGRLLAMAGDRMKQPGFSEISGVAVHPDAQGRGLGKHLSLHMTRLVLARGEVPYLHAYTTNARAIGLYEGIGFAVRTELNVVMVEREVVAA